MIFVIVSDVIRAHMFDVAKRSREMFSRDYFERRCSLNAYLFIAHEHSLRTEMKTKLCAWNFNDGSGMLK